ncbi:MAG: exosortase-associated EpsI family protein [Planctomycetota bacterium]|nr:exosortase-associated EpsI family protein [Planctomycetota bacterium]
MKRSPRQLLNLAAPVVTAAILIGSLATSRIDADAGPGAEQYHADVRAAIDKIPYRVGPWVGADLEAPPAAVKLLKPNRLLQRRYVDPATGESFSLLVVHCADMRDMRGHYPPICYPAHGWTQDAAEMESFTWAGGRYPGVDYDFHRVVRGTRQEMKIFGFFILPDGRIVAEMDELSRAAGRRSTTQLGAAQVQIIGGEELSEERRSEIINEFVRAIEPTIRTIAEGAAQ